MGIFQVLQNDPTNRAALASLADAIAGSAAFDPQAIANALSPYGAGTVVLVQWGPNPLQKQYAWVSGDSVIFLFSGLATAPDFIAAYLASGQVATTTVQGLIMALGNAVMAGGTQVIDQTVVNAAASLGLPQVNVLIAGHSFGAVLATAYITQHVGPLPSQIGAMNMVTFGGPRTLNPSAANQMVVPHTRIVSSDDLIPMVPLYDWFNGFPFTLFTPTSLLFYSHWGTGIQLDALGTASYLGRDNADNDPNIWRLIDLGSGFAGGDPAHSLETYAGRLRMTDAPVEGTPGHPPVFFFPQGVSNMATYKTIWFFSQGPYGWSEVAYQEKPDATQALTNAGNLQLIAARRALMGAKVSSGAWVPSISAIRVSNVDQPRDSDVIFIAGGVPGSNTQDDANIPDTAVLVRWQAIGSFNFKYNKTQFLRGSPDDVLTKGGQYTFEPQFAGAIPQYESQLKSLGFGLYAQDKNVQPINNAALAQVGADIQVTTITPHGFASGDKVTCTGVKPVFSERTTFKITNAAGSVYTIPLTTLRTPLTALGHSKLVSKIFLPLDNLAIKRGGHRNAGGPFFRPVGRRKERQEV